jgi:hypothetical protein
METGWLIYVLCLLGTNEPIPGNEDAPTGASGSRSILNWTVKYKYKPSAQDSPQHVFARMLFQRGLGFPMWVPEPDVNLPNCKRSLGVDVGDVGLLLSDGSFDFLFNINLPADHPINYMGIPNGFHHMPLDSCDVRILPNDIPQGAVFTATDPGNGGGSASRHVSASVSALGLCSSSVSFSPG